MAESIRKMTEEEQIARITHEINRAYCQAIGDDSQPTWEAAPSWQRDSAITRALVHMAVAMTPEESHASWMALKTKEGWTYGPIKDPIAKQHPCMLPWKELPLEQRVKDHLFCAVVRLMHTGGLPAKLTSK